MRAIRVGGASVGAMISPSPFYGACGQTLICLDDTPGVGKCSVVHVGTRAKVRLGTATHAIRVVPATKLAS